MTPVSHKTLLMRFMGDYYELGACSFKSLRFSAQAHQSVHSSVIYGFSACGPSNRTVAASKGAGFVFLTHPKSAASHLTIVNLRRTAFCI